MKENNLNTPPSGIGDQIMEFNRFSAIMWELDIIKKAKSKPVKLIKSLEKTRNKLIGEYDKKYGTNLLSHF